jgi:long-chain acyl-CoA synthetase
MGQPIENAEMKIMSEDGRELAAGEWGEICIKGPIVMHGYWNKPEGTAAAIRTGWLHSGDIGVVDDEGYFSIVDRTKDVINVSGFKVWPAEVKHTLYEHPAIHEAAVLAWRMIRAPNASRLILCQSPVSRSRPTN